MKTLSYKEIMKSIRNINYFIYLISKKITIEIVILISCYIGAVLGLFRAVGLRSLDVPYIFFSRDAFPPNSYAVEWATHSWSLVHQIGYLGYLSGFDHRQMSLAISAVTGAAMVTGLALLIFSISRNGLLAILAAPLIATHPIFRIFDTDYVNQYIGSEHLSWQGSTFVILTIGLASVGFFRSAGFLVMLTISIHLIFGAWAAILLGFFSTLLFFQKKFDNVFAILKGLLIGALFLFASYLTDQFFFTTTSEFPADDNAFLIWSKFWGYHRVANLNTQSIIGTYGWAAIILLFIKLNKFNYIKYNYKVIVLLILSIVLSTFMYIVGHLNFGVLSEILTKIIPGRFMMFNTFFVLIFIISGLYHFDIRRIFRKNFVRPIFIIMLFSFLPTYLLLTVPFAMIFMIATTQFFKKTESWISPYAHAVNVAIVVAFFTGTSLLVAYSDVGSARNTSIASIEPGAKCKGIAVEGLVLAASYTQYAIAQRRCDLPALIDPSAINSLPYIPWAASEMRRIISVAYGVSFENQPAVTRNRGMILEGAFKQVWEARTAAEWGRVANEFGVGAVMVPPDWVLDLGAPIAEEESYKLYSVE